MEAAGLAVGIPGLFTSCLDLYDKFHIWKRRETDLLVYFTQLEFQRLRFLKLQTCFLYKGRYRHANNLIELILRTTHQILRELIELWSRHGAAAAQKSWNGKGVARSFGWVGSDKSRMVELLNQLEQQTANLSQLLTESQREGVAYQVRAEVVKTSNHDTLHGIHTGLLPENRYYDVVLAAQIRALTIDIENGSETQGNYAKSMKNTQLMSKTSIKWARPPAEKQWKPPWGDECNLSDVVDWDHAVGTLTDRKLLSDFGASDQFAQPVLVEWRSGFRSLDNTSACAYRLNQLVFTLQKMSDASSLSPPEANSKINFRILRCLGWLTSGAGFRRVGLVFAFPHTSQKRPTPLNDLVRATRDQSYTPSLSTRFSMAQALTRALANFVAVGWLHRAFRSHNVLLFDDNNVTELFLVGFCYARPDNGTDLSTLPEEDPSFHLYRPPASMGWPDREVQGSSSINGSEDATKQGPIGVENDIFGLGIVLLEIGLWRTASSLKKEVSRGEPWKLETLELLVNRLGPRTGDIYRDVVRRCLMLEGFWSGEVVVLDFLKGILEDLLSCRV